LDPQGDKQEGTEYIGGEATVSGPKLRKEGKRRCLLEAAYFFIYKKISFPPPL